MIRMLDRDDEIGRPMIYAARRRGGSSAFRGKASSIYFGVPGQLTLIYWMSGAEIRRGVEGVARGVRRVTGHKASSVTGAEDAALSPVTLSRCVRDPPGGCLLRAHF